MENTDQNSRNAHTHRIFGQYKKEFTYVTRGKRNNEVDTFQKRNLTMTAPKREAS